MAVVSFLVQPQAGACDALKKTLSGQPGLTVLPWETPACLVVVAECAAADLEAVGRRITRTPGVLSMTVAYCTIEDELPTTAAATA